MKKISFLYCLTLLGLIFWACNSPAERKNSNKELLQNEKKEAESSYSRVAFINNADSNINRTLKELLNGFGFEVYDKTAFWRFKNYFDTLFGNNSNNANRFNVTGFPFSIAEMYNRLQAELAIQDTFSIDAGYTVKNVFRIYPAIDTFKNMYLVILKEYYNDSLVKLHTGLNIYFTIKDTLSSSIVDTNEQKRINTDIIRFQKTWLNLGKLKSSGLIFDTCRSFSYTVTAYDQLLSNQDSVFWNLDSCKSPSNCNDIIIRFYPIIDTMKTTEVRFRLVAVPCIKIGKDYVPDSSRNFFDNMFPCPKVCPVNEIN